MKKIIAKKDFTIGNQFYIENEEIKNVDYETIVKLNEQGFIEPLNYKDLVLIKRELDNPKKENYKKEEEKINGTAL